MKKKEQARSSRRTLFFASYLNSVIGNVKLLVRATKKNDKIKLNDDKRVQAFRTPSKMEKLRESPIIRHFRIDISSHHQIHSRPVFFLVRHVGPLVFFITLFDGSCKKMKLACVPLSSDYPQERKNDAMNFQNGKNSREFYFTRTTGSFWMNLCEFPIKV